jgi:hypothetical protein
MCPLCAWDLQSCVLRSWQAMVMRRIREVGRSAASVNSPHRPWRREGEEMLLFLLQQSETVRGLIRLGRLGFARLLSRSHGGFNLQANASAVCQAVKQLRAFLWQLLAARSVVLPNHKTIGCLLPPACSVSVGFRR